MRITRKDAEAFFAHPSQNKLPLLDHDVSPDLVMYHADGPVCAVFHWAARVGVLHVHIGVKPSGWGGTVEPFKRLMQEAWAEHAPERIIGWINENNRALRAFCLRAGMVQDGVLPLPEPVLMFGWRL